MSNSDTAETTQVEAPLKDRDGNPVVVQLVGRDGNAFAILGACRKAARRAGVPGDQIEAVLAEMMSGDYDALLATAMKYFEVE